MDIGSRIDRNKRINENEERTMIVQLQSNLLGTTRTYLSSRVHKFVTPIVNGA